MDTGGTTAPRRRPPEKQRYRLRASGRSPRTTLAGAATGDLSGPTVPVLALRVKYPLSGAPTSVDPAGSAGMPAGDPARAIPLPDMPFPARLLNPGEEVAADIRPHWWFLAAPGASAVAVLAGAVAAGVAGASRPVDLAVVAVMAVALAWLVARYLRWRGTHLFVTSDRLVHRQGLLARRGTEIPLEHLSDIGYRQTIWQRLLAAGDLVLESAGRDSREVFPWLPHPGMIQNEIYRQIDASRNGRPLSVAGELERLDELRRRGVLTQAEFEAQKARLLSR